jgi:hypothetical protein
MWDIGGAWTRPRADRPSPSAGSPTPTSPGSQTFEYEGEAGHAPLEVSTFVDLGGGRCRVDGLSVFRSVADRDAVLQDLDAGRDEDVERLVEHLAAAGEH